MTLKCDTKSTSSKDHCSGTKVRSASTDKGVATVPDSLSLILGLESDLQNPNGGREGWLSHGGPCLHVQIH